MSGGRILSDRLLRELIATGQIDLLVGMPTFNCGSTLGSALRAMQHGLAAHFPKERTLLLVADRRSTDDTIAVAALGGDPTSLLRTSHRITASDFATRGDAMRAILAAADLLRARTVVIVDPDVTSLEKDWLDKLARPVLTGDFDYVSRRYDRAPFEGPLITQLMRPLLAASFGKVLAEPVGGELACSGRFVAQCLESTLWEGELGRSAADPALVTAAIAGGFRVTEARLGAHVVSPRPGARSLTEIFVEMVSALFNCLEVHEGHWLHQGTLESVSTVDPEAEPVLARSTPDWLSMAGGFAPAVRDLAPVLAQILSEDTLRGVGEIAARPPEALTFPDGLWVRTLFEFAAAQHARVMHPDHLAQTLLPLYLGRVAAFFREHCATPHRAERAVEQLCRTFHQERTYLVELWTRDPGKRGAPAPAADGSRAPDVSALAPQIESRGE